jgi:hypothetical protein
MMLIILTVKKQKKKKNKHLPDLHWSKSFLSALIPFVKSSSSSSRDSSNIRPITKIEKKFSINQLVDFWSIFG